MPIKICIVFEDVLSEAVIEKLLTHVGKNVFDIDTRFHTKGFAKMKANMNAYNSAATAIPYFVLTDLDKNTCASELVENWLPKEKQNIQLIFRVAVRQVESWLLSDRDGFAKFASVSVHLLAENPDMLPDSKQGIFDAVSKSSQKSLKEDILPKTPGDRMGPAYNVRLIDFVHKNWNITVAAKASASLKKTVVHLERFVEEIIKKIRNDYDN